MFLKPFKSLLLKLKRGKWDEILPKICFHCCLPLGIQMA
jgi:hypothetical protein